MGQVPVVVIDIQAPKEKGAYYYSLFATWLKDKEKRISEGSSSYVFVIEVID